MTEEVRQALIIEAVATAVLLGIACYVPRPFAVWAGVAERALRRLARRRGLSVALVGLVAIAGSAGVSLLIHMPVPAINDEFSYLLAADTFASGRLTNPTHPMWEHFESMHIIHQPTYASKYPPGQGLALAVGQVLGGHPIVGVWLSAGLACAALTWMLQAWLPAGWALLGGLLAVARLATFSYWGQSYWGGAVGATGGALVFGALRRLVRRPQVREALLLGVGVAILANSRPYEGLLVSLPAGAALCLWMIGRKGPPARVALGRLVPALLVVLALTGLAMAFYNLRVTGRPLVLPYQVHEERYSIAPAFLWQRLRPEPAYRHDAIRRFNEIMALKHSEQVTLSGWRRAKVGQFRRLWRFYLGPLLTVPLVTLPWLLKDRWMRFAGLTFGALLAGLLVETWIHPHYVSPITGLGLVIVMEALRRLRVWRWGGRPAGRFMVWGILILCVVFAPLTRRDVHAWSLQRARLVAPLLEDGGRHLVVVRYRPEHHPYEEWVYNQADIDRARVVWAREMDAVRNRRLLEYFKDRRAWLLEADAEPPRLAPYPAATEGTGRKQVSISST